MEKQTVFIKRYPSKGELPKDSGIYITNIGELKYYSGTSDWTAVNRTKLDGSDDRLPKYWFEEIELPSEEEIDKSGDDFAYPHIDSAFAFNCFMHGANFILNKLKGEAK